MLNKENAYKLKELNTYSQSPSHKTGKTSCSPPWLSESIKYN